MSKANILVVEDKFLIAEEIAGHLRKLGYTVVAIASTGEEALKKAKILQPELAIMDIGLSGEFDGIETAKRLRESLKIPVIYVTAYSDQETLQRAAHTEPLGYLLKPIEERQLYITMELALNVHRAQKLQYADIKSETISQSITPREPLKSEFRHIVCSDECMFQLLERVELVAKTDVTVHIYGENGTGKELIADALHNLSARKEKRFVKLNCSAIPSSLLESSLFGHSRGSFTGAAKDHEGFIEHAQGGTLFLDEIADISHDIQVKLLRVLQNREYSRVGETRVRQADIRVITATNRNLKDFAQQGKIREDFYYRINVFPLIVPSLRQRRSDIRLIAEYFVNVFNKLFAKNVKGYSLNALKALENYPWPGNVRELENTIKYAFVMVTGDTIDIEHLPSSLFEGTRPSHPEQEPSSLLSRIIAESADEKDPASEKEVILEALRRMKGNKTRAAKLLGYSRVTLWKKMGKYALSEIQ